MNGYVAFYKQKRFEVYAKTLLEAKEKAEAYYRVPVSKRHLVSVMLAEKNGETVTHTADF